ncbi:MAG: hypothetical protein GY719_13250 [bacterium]|nr:hypothetical protein [bacterium]
MAKLPSIHWPWIRVWLLPYFGLVAVHLAIGGNGYYPTVHPDEVIYREMARYLASVGPVPNLADTFVFPVGYPLLISPLFRWFEDFGQLGFALLLLNSLMASAVVFPALVFLRRILGVSERYAVPAAVAVGVYPAYLVIAGMALTQHAFVPLYATLVILAWRLYRRQGLLTAALLGFGSAILYAVHERALLVMAVAVTQVALLAVIGHLRKHVAAVAIGAAALGYVAVGALKEDVYAAVYRGGGVSRPLTDVLEKFLDVPGWVDFLLQVPGQLWYLLVATYGLFGVAVAMLVKLAWTSRNEIWKSGPGTATVHGVLFLLATAGAIFTTCAIYFPRNPIMPVSSEFYFFGRINEGFLALFLAAGLAALSPEKLRGSVSTSRTVPNSLIVMFVCGTIMVLGRGMEELADDPRTYGVFGVRWFLRDDAWLIHPVLGTLLLAIVWGTVHYAFRRRALLLQGIVALSFLIISADLSTHYFGRRQQRQYRRSLPPMVAAAGGIDAVSIDASRMRTGRWADMIRRVEIQNFSDRRREKPTTPVVIAHRAWQRAKRHRARFLAADRDTDYALWVMPGEEQERLYQPPDIRSVAYGAQSIWSVWEDGFSERELWRGAEPMRWTRGRGELRIPFTGAPPVALHIDIAATGQDDTDLDLEINDLELIETRIPSGGWSRTLPLQRFKLDKSVYVKIKSDRSPHNALFYGAERPYNRGVLIRAIYLLDTEEMAALAEPPAAGPLHYRLDTIGSTDDLVATSREPLVLTLRVANTGDHPWLGRLGGEATPPPRLLATWHASSSRPTADSPAVGTVAVDVARPVLPGRVLHLGVAVDPRADTSSPLPPGDYRLRLAIAPPNGEAADDNEPLVLAVTVRKPRPGFFAPIRVLARNVHAAEPPFTLMPF